MKTLKGYTLTPNQAERRADLAQFLAPGPSYRRDIRDALNSMQYAETADQVDYWLEQADRKSYDYR